MTEEEKKDKIVEYSERQSFWTNQILNQFGYSINLFLTFGIGFFTYLVAQRNNYPKIILDCKSEIHWSLTIYLTAMFLAFISIVAGSISVLSRLYDLRITRHIILVRKRAIKKIGKLLPDDFIDINNDSIWINFWITLKNKLAFIVDNDFNDCEHLKKRFNGLRKQSKLLGDLSWVTHKIQVLLVIVATIIYGLTIINK